MLCYDFSHFLPPKKIVIHIHITYWSHNQLSARVDSTSASPQINFLVASCPWAYAGFAKGVNFLGAGRVACRERGFGGMIPRENFSEWCNLVRFGSYFHKCFTLKKSKKKKFFIQK